MTMNEEEKRAAAEKIAREAKHLEKMAREGGRDFLAYLLANVVEEAEKAQKRSGDD